MRHVKILEEFAQKVSRERLTGVISVAVVFALGFVFVFGQVSIPAYNFSLPQFKLGFAFLAIGVTWAGIAFWLFSRARREAAPAGTGIDDENMFNVPIVMPPPPKIRIQVAGEGDGMIFYKNESVGELRAYLDVVNFTSAAVKIDRIIGDITVANGTVAALSHFKKQTVAAISSGSVCVLAELSAEHVRKIEFQLNQHRDLSAGLNLTVYVVTPDGEEELHPRLATGNCRFVNFTRK